MATNFHIWKHFMVCMSGQPGYGLMGGHNIDYLITKKFEISLIFHGLEISITESESLLGKPDFFNTSYHVFVSLKKERYLHHSSISMQLTSQ